MKVVAAALAAALVLAGCTDNGPQPNYSSAPRTSSVSASPSPSVTGVPTTGPNVRPGEVPPTPDPLVSQNTAEGAQAFAAFYWKQVNWAYSTNNGAPLTGLYTAGCASCHSFQSSIDDTASKGLELSGGHITVKGLALAQTDEVAGAQYGVDVSLGVEELRTVDASGTTEKTYPATTGTQRLYEAWSDGAWMVLTTATVERS